MSMLLKKNNKVRMLLACCCSFDPRRSLIIDFSERLLLTHTDTEWCVGFFTESLPSEDGALLLGVITS